jgi:hypothetical protein
LIFCTIIINQIEIMQKTKQIFEFLFLPVSLSSIPKSIASDTLISFCVKGCITDVITYVAVFVAIVNSSSSTDIIDGGRTLLSDDESSSEQRV